jgi:phosphoenolpyruvate carboxylase
MVERSMASAPIARRTLDSILENMTRGLSRYQGAAKSAPTSSPALDAFADGVAEVYRAQVQEPDFLRWVELATPYSYLNLLKIGSRPTKRTASLSVASLRAIPWVLCWTQTRVLFPTWWGTGTVWAGLTPAQKNQLRGALKTHSVFRSYIKALGFTLAKIEMPVWKLTLEKNLPSAEAKKASTLFHQEHQKALRFYHELTGEGELLWFRPWLGESIRLRSPMIHPLNLLQIIAAQTKDAPLLRVTVTGISSGMLTTG